VRYASQRSVQTVIIHHLCSNRSNLSSTAPVHVKSLDRQNSPADAILLSLQQVASERAQRDADPALAGRVAAVKRFQHARFEHSYADLMADRRYAGATRFFLEDLYGPGDFTHRDTQFARIVPALVRLFPRDIVSTVAELAALHALSEQLDSAMALALDDAQINPATYSKAWRFVGQPEARDRQIALMVSVGQALDRHTRNPLLRHSLRLMRSPAKAAGLGALQRFLETGFDTFRAMKGAADFLDTIASREREMAALLFAGGEVSPSTDS